MDKIEENPNLQYLHIFVKFPNQNLFNIQKKTADVEAQH
jgi:hypothetical protein